MPRAPILQEVGSRLHWHKAPRQILHGNLTRSTGVRLTNELFGQRGPTDAYRVMTAAVRHLRPVLACASDVVTRNCKRAYIGRETPKLGLRRFVRPTVTRLQVTWTRRKRSSASAETLKNSLILLAQLPDITGKVLVYHCRASDDCHTNALQELWDLHGRALGFEKVFMIGKQGHEAEHAKKRWQSPFRPGAHDTYADAFLKYIRWASEQTDVLDNLTLLRDSSHVCVCLAHEPCHGDFLASAIPSPFARATMRP